MNRPFPGQRFLLGIGGCVLVVAVWVTSPSSTAQSIESPAAPSTEVITNVVSVPGAVAPTNMSPGVAEVARLAQANVSEEMLLTYIATADFQFSPTVDEILYLADLGISEKVINAIMNRAKEVREKSASATQQPAPAQPTNATAAAPPAPTQPQPSVEAGTAPPAPNQEVTVVQAPTQPVTVNYFYETLSPYGSWLEIADYGWCWRPTVVALNPGWRPYADRGRWVYTDYGWYWQSDYSWGWAAFHYGRWHCAPSYGWVWVPGTTWGPAWVSWRSSADYCGWAPLPPEAHYSHSVGFTYRSSGLSFNFEFGVRREHYTFVPVRRFCERDLHRHYVPPQEIPGVIGDTVVHNRYGHRGDVLVNGGIETDRLVAVTHKPIQPVAIRDGLGRGEVLDRSSDTLYVHRPTLAPVPGGSGGVGSKPLSGGGAFKPGGGPQGSGGVVSGSPSKQPFAPAAGNPNSGSGFAGSPQPSRAPSTAFQPAQPQHSPKQSQPQPQPHWNAPANGKHQGSPAGNSGAAPKHGFASPQAPQNQGGNGGVESKQPKVNVGQPVNHGSQFSPRFVTPSPAIAPAPATKPVTPLSPRQYEKPSVSAPTPKASAFTPQPVVPSSKPGNQSGFQHNQPGHKQPVVSQPTPSRPVISSPAQPSAVAAPKAAWTAPAQRSPSFSTPAPRPSSLPQASNPQRGNAYGHSPAPVQQKSYAPAPQVIESRPAAPSYSPPARQYTPPTPAQAPAYRAPAPSAPAYVPSQRPAPSAPAMASGRQFGHSQGGGQGPVPGHGGNGKKH